MILLAPLVLVALRLLLGGGLFHIISTGLAWPHSKWRMLGRRGVKSQANNIKQHSFDGNILLLGTATII